MVPGELDLTVACSGCADDTAALARSSGHPVRVLEREAASKAAALRPGEAVARGFPRICLDADVVLPGSSARAVLEKLRAGRLRHNRRPATTAAAPLRRSAATTARVRVPALLGSLWGAGVYGLSAAGRSRFGMFDDVVAGDLWVDRQFAPEEIEIVDCELVVAVPQRAGDLVGVLGRTYRGKAEPAGVDPYDRAQTTTTSTLQQLRRLAATGPSAAVDAATHTAFALGARLALAAPAPGAGWERDDSWRT